jgi:hypothetical protein
MRYVFGLVLAAGLLLAPASRANAQVAVSVGYPGYYSYPGYAYSSGSVSVNVPGFSFYSGGYTPAVYAAPVVSTYAAPVATTYVPAPVATTYVPARTYYAPSYYSVRAPYVYTSGYYGYYPGVRVRVGY